jgi:toxin-antitoxin system PIN domain toxin
VLITDVNILIDAHRLDSPDHARSKRWLEDRLNALEPFGVSELVLSAFVRIVTNHRVMRPAALPAEALDFCDVVLAAPVSVVVAPGPRHWSIFADLVRTVDARANVVRDAYLAALAIENGATFVTRDRGFTRFPGLRLLDPRAE